MWREDFERGTREGKERHQDQIGWTDSCCMGLNPLDPNGPVIARHLFRKVFLVQGREGITGDYHGGGRVVSGEKEAR